MPFFGDNHFQCSTWPSAKERLQPWLCRSAGMLAPHQLEGIPAHGLGIPKMPSSMLCSCSSMKTRVFVGGGLRICENLRRLMDISFTPSWRSPDLIYTFNHAFAE